MDGGVRLKSILSGYFRLQYPKAPEQYVNALVDQLTSDAALTSAATHLGMHHLVRTLDFPPTEDTLATAFKALISVLSYDRCKKTIAEAILPKIVGVAFEDVLPFSRPLEIVPHYAKKVYGESPKTEPRILHSSGLDTVTPLWVVGIYVNEQLVGSAPGETLPVAIDLAAQATLLRLWDVGVHRLAFQPNLLEQDLAEVPQNHSIYDVCPSEVDLSLLTPEELAQDPVNIFQAATNYYDLEKKLGRQRVKVLRHRFSRGSLFKRSFRYLVKPLPHSV